MRFQVFPDQDLAGVFSNDTRRRIVEIMLRDGEATVSNLAEEIGVAKSTVSHHVKILVEAGVVELGREEPTKHGMPRKYYRVGPALLPAHLQDDVRGFERVLDASPGRGGTALGLMRAMKTCIIGLGVDADSLLTSAGKRIGREHIAPHVEGDDFEEVLRSTAGFWEREGLGSVEIVEMGTRDATIRVYDCFDCGGMPDVGEELCDFDAGVLAGVISTHLDRGCRVRETRCWGTGHQYCQFRITLD